VTALLRQVEQGDSDASERLADLVYAELRRLAARFLAGERAGHSLQPTLLVHEAWLRIVPGSSGEARSRSHFMAIAARAMRRILVEHARAHGRQKRGGDWQRVSFAEVPPGASPEANLDEMLDLDRALRELAQAHPRPARVVELRSFAGLTIEETTPALGVSHVTVEDDWALARAWLSRALRRRRAPGGEEKPGLGGGRTLALGNPPAFVAFLHRSCSSAWLRRQRPPRLASTPSSSRQCATNSVTPAPSERVDRYHKPAAAGPVKRRHRLGGILKLLRLEVPTMRPPRLRNVTLSFGLVLASSIAPVGAVPPAPVTIQILSVSDWHAQLDPIADPGGGAVGGAAVLSAYWQADRAAIPGTITLTAGDSFGASPPLAAMFAEEPGVRAMNLMGFQADTLGNHNFDHGLAQLQQLIDLAEFPFLSANLENLAGNLTGVERFRVFEVGGVKVGVIGVTNPDATALVFPGQMGTLTVGNPVPAANAARAQAQAAGAKVLVALTHLGVTATTPPAGPLIDFAENVGNFDVILGDHTDVQFAAMVNDALVVENRSKGLSYARIKLVVNPLSGQVLDRSVEFVTPRVNLVTPDPLIVAMLSPYRSALPGRVDRVIGVATDLFPRGANIERLRETALGNLVADSMAARYATTLAFTNGGGLRAPLPSSYPPADHTLRRTTAGYAAGPPYDLVAGDAFTELPFGNSIVTRTVTGAQLHAVLEHSVASIPAANGRFLQISRFRFTYDSSRPPGSRLVSVALNDGTPILPDATTYTVATNDFINRGGDGYTMLADGQGEHREVMADVLMEHIEDAGTVTPVVDGRITRLP
jgi:5'-nucleotidase